VSDALLFALEMLTVFLGLETVTEKLNCIRAGRFELSKRHGVADV
jgi:hypothetical protein